MSMILKGIDRPKMGEKRRITIFDNGDVVVKEERWDEDGYKHYKTSYDVEAIQIPKDHGRIGEIDRVWNDEGGEQFYDEPVLLEAEEEECINHQ